MREVARLFLVLLGAVGCATAPTAGPAAPGYVRVHFDHLDPTKVAQFVEARQTWLAAIRKEGAPDPWWGSFFEVEGAGFMALRPLASFGELDRPPPAEPDTAEHQAAAKRYDQMADASLVFPHLTQIWAADDDLTYLPEVPVPLYNSACVGTAVFEGVEPTRSEAYGNAWVEILAALRKARYPLTRYAFGSRFGDGRRTALWLAPSQAVLEKAPRWEAALEQAVGAARAQELIATIDHSVVSSESHPVHGRPDLSTWPGPGPR